MSGGTPKGADLEFMEAKYNATAGQTSGTWHHGGRRRERGTTEHSTGCGLKNKFSNVSTDLPAKWVLQIKLKQRKAADSQAEAEGSWNFATLLQSPISILHYYN